MKTEEEIKNKIKSYENLITQVDTLQRRDCRAKINILEWVLEQR